MARTIDYYFSLLSPWAFIGHATFADIARRHGAGVNHKPVLLLSLFPETGGLPLNQRHPSRQRYRMLELQRWRERRGLTFNLRPRHWPLDAQRADRAVIAISAAGQEPDAYIRAAFAAIWQDERNLADLDELRRVLSGAGYDADAIVEQADGPLTEAVYVLNRENAVEGDVFGSPAYVLDGEVFWGQDRLDFLDDALTSGRPRFLHDAER